MEIKVNGMTLGEYGRLIKKGRKLPPWNKVSIRSVTSKEGSESGYPAPHMLVIFDHPIFCRRYKGRGHSRFIIADQEWKNKVFGFTDEHGVCHNGKIWKRGYVDVRGIVGNKIGKRSAVAYPFKYVIKGCKSGKRDIAFKTMAWHKKFNLRAIQISKQFKEILNPVRLDRILNESQQVSPHYWVFDRIEFVKLSDFGKIMIKREKSRTPPT